MTSFFRTLCAAAGVFAVCATAAQAQPDYPSQPVRLVTAFAAGSASDIVARMFSEKLRAALGQPVIVENKPGASGQIATDYVAHAQPDGYTLLLATNTTHSSNPHLFRKLRYDPIADFTPLVQVCNFPFLLVVGGKLPVRNVGDLLKYGNANRGSVNYAYGNSTGQIAAASFNKITSMDAAAVPYKSTPQAMTDVIGGQTSFMFVDLASAASQIQAGNLKALAVSSGKRSALVPDLPTVSESLGKPGFDLVAWVGIFGPARMPASIAKRLGDELYKIAASREVDEKLRHLGAEPTPAPAYEFGVFVARQKAVWGEKVREAGIQPE
jgi:tripartite-type tricarboxylate transporter receptor subunit TctC